MKKNFALLLIAILIFTVSCASNPIDLGIHDPGNTPEEDLVTLYIDRWCKVDRIDNYLVDSLPDNHSKNKIIKLNPGVHTLFTDFKNGALFSFSSRSMPITAQFEKGNIYYLDHEIKMVQSRIYNITFHILLYNNGKKGKEVTDKPMKNLIEIFLFYTSFVKSPLNRGESVKLENKKYTLVYKPDGVYTQIDKESGITVNGKYWYENKDIMSTVLGYGFWVKIYFFDADANIMKKSKAWGRKEHDVVDYDAAHTVLVLINSTDKEVTYQYEKPSELKGTKITFSISEVK